MPYNCGDLVETKCLARNLNGIVTRVLSGPIVAEHYEVQLEDGWIATFFDVHIQPAGR
jgi:hypothetical protein